MSPHDLRHTAASFLLAEGANPWMLAEILGHRDTRMIDLVYGHLFDKDREALRQRMSRRARDGSIGHNGKGVRLPRAPRAGELEIATDVSATYPRRTRL
ncbi:MAG: tyrosine-type recombinase/integrase [Actinomycetota bacterium]|nr:tyrosine-type recombinase/integrase [Actinomycetota bacterium]